MHIQPLFAEHDAAELRRLIRAYPLATLTVCGATGLESNLLPLELQASGDTWRLAGHVARSHAMRTSAEDGTAAVAVFQSPNAYISPSWYVNGQRSRRNAPSWNYIAVQARGRLRFIDDPAWLHAHLAAMTDQQEAGREAPWSIDDADPAFIEESARRLIGFTIEIDDLVCKRFMSQQRTEADRRSLIEHLAREESPGARAVASLIRP